MAVVVKERAWPDCAGEVGARDHCTAIDRGLGLGRVDGREPAGTVPGQQRHGMEVVPATDIGGVDRRAGDSGAGPDRRLNR